MNRLFSLLCSFALLITAQSLQAQMPTPQTSKQQAQTEKIKKKIEDLGVLKEVTVKLQSGEKLKGRIAEIKTDAFSLKLEDPNQTTPRDINYAEVKSVSGKKGGGGQVAYRVLFGPAGIGGAVLLGVLVAMAAAGTR
ncbi:MAG TPA: hypothetical protein VEF04_23230 [Blastocatellia bacterium]|nr:hypothetical protein [Blastocatellia bacterium]